MASKTLPAPWLREGESVEVREVRAAALERVQREARVDEDTAGEALVEASRLLAELDARDLRELLTWRVLAEVGSVCRGLSQQGTRIFRRTGRIRDELASDLAATLTEPGTTLHLAARCLLIDPPPAGGDD